jgi:hypothetical protein
LKSSENLIGVCAAALLSGNADAAARTSPIRPSRMTSWAVILVPFFLDPANSAPARTCRAAVGVATSMGFSKEHAVLKCKHGRIEG